MRGNVKNFTHTPKFVAASANNTNISKHRIYRTMNFEAIHISIHLPKTLNLLYRPRYPIVTRSLSSLRGPLVRVLTEKYLRR